MLHEVTNCVVVMQCLFFLEHDKNPTDAWQL
jgi:hypothetical protein